MDITFQRWFGEGRVIEALCGYGSYFIPDHTWRDEHDRLLALSQLLSWARPGHEIEATNGFEGALQSLLVTADPHGALDLFHCYLIISKEHNSTLPIDEDRVVLSITSMVNGMPERICRDEELRVLLLSIANKHPALKAALKLEEGI